MPMDSFNKKALAFMEKTKRSPSFIWRKIWKVGRDDPRRAIHSLKVGFSLTLVSLLYLMEPLFKGVGQNAIWAVMTVVVVLEFTAGKLYLHISTHTHTRTYIFIIYRTIIS